MNRRHYKSPIPKMAKEVVVKWYENGAKQESNYFVGRKLVGRRYWWDDGQTVEFEIGLRDGKKHGNELRFYPDGQLMSVEPHRNGREHGKATQFASDGSVLIYYVLKDGIGLDLWCHDDGSLSEEHCFPDSGDIGYSRWWNEDNRSIYLEESWLNGSGWHGILREWNRKGKLCRGFPKFYVTGQRLTKRQYLRACESDQSLPPYHSEQDKPYRTLPKEYLAQRKNGCEDMEAEPCTK